MFSKKLIALTAAGAFAFAGLALMPSAVAMEQDQQMEEAAPQTVIGVVDSVGDDKFTLKHGANHEQSTEFTINDDTQYLLDGAASTKDRVLRDEANVAVTHRDGKATTIAGISQ